MVLLLLGLQSCSLAIKPDLERLYQQNREVRQPPVIVIHGLMGSRLEDTASGKEIWVGNPVKLLLSDYAATTLEIDPETLENAGRYRRAEPRYGLLSLAGSKRNI